MKSNRYRFWRMLFVLLGSGLVGLVVGYVGASFDLANISRFQIDWSIVQWILMLLAISFFVAEMYYLVQTRKAGQLLLTLSDDDEIEQADKTANRAYNIASILSSMLGVLMFLTLSILITSLIKEEETLVMTVQTIMVTVFSMISSRLVRLYFKDVHGKEMPKNMSTKETQDFLLSVLDEAEKQIQYEENFNLILKLSGYILPGIYVFLFALRMFFGIDVLLTVFVVSALYIYILISQYRIVKRYYK